MHEHNEILVALVGQPNSGKSTVFNFLTGLHQTIANYPGVTVTKKSGHYHDGRRRIEVVDLPGTYSLTSYSQEERVTRDFLLLERPEVVVAIVDASNLRRHLFFVFQLLELRIPLVVCLNMTDIARRRGISIDVAKLEKELGVPVIPTNGRTGAGLEDLRKTVNEISALHDHEPSPWHIDYGPLEDILAHYERTLAQKDYLAKDFSTRWLAVKLLENDREARRIVQHHIHERDWESLLESCLDKAAEYERTHGESPRKMIAARRNLRAEEIETLVQDRPMIPKRNSDTADRFLCHPVLGFAFIAVVMLLTFQLAFNMAQGWTWLPWPDEEGGLGWTTPVEACEMLFSEWPKAALDATLELPEGDWKSLLYNGIIDGVGGVLVFVPVIFFIFLFMSALEQSGYIARVVVVLDRVMRFFGLHGQSVLPMILGGGMIGGCAVPAVMATRTMREQRERLLTILVVPIMNCGAKIPVYALLISAFFMAWKGAVMAAIIFISWALALLSAWALGKTLVKGEPTPLVIELPTYQIPGLFDVLRTALLQSWWFVKKAGTIILAVNVLLWVWMYYPSPADPDAGMQTRLEGSYAAKIGRFFEPVSRWAGFDWRDNVALVGGFAAKEVIVSSLSTIYGIEEEGEEESAENESAQADGAEAVKGTGSAAEDDPIWEELDDQGRRLSLLISRDENWSPTKAFAMLLFVMVYAPCIPTCVVIWQETGAVKYMLIAMAYTTALALVLAVVFYQVGSLLTG